MNPRDALTLRIEPNRQGDGYHWYLRTDYSYAERTGAAGSVGEALEEVMRVVRQA